MKAWHTALTGLGWVSVLALVSVNLHLLALATYAVVALWAVSTMALLKTAPFPARGIAFAVSWVGPLLVIVSDIYSYPNHRLELLTLTFGIQMVTYILVFAWFFTYGMLPFFAVFKLLRPKMRCRAFEGTEQVPWRYWWAATLLVSVIKFGGLWFAWSIASSATKP